MYYKVSRIIFTTFEIFLFPPDVNHTNFPFHWQLNDKFNISLGFHTIPTCIYWLLYAWSLQCNDNGRPYIVQREYWFMRQGYFRTSDTSTLWTIWNVTMSVCFAKLCAKRRFWEEFCVYLCYVASSTLCEGDINEIFLFVTLIMSVSLVAA